VHTINLAQAKAQLSHLIELVEAGEEVTITRRGRAVARLVGERAVRQSLPSLTQLRAMQPMQPESAGGFVRELRESDRY